MARLIRWQNDTLKTLLAAHLIPTRRLLEGEMDDLRQVRAKQKANVPKKEERRNPSGKKNHIAH